MSKPAPIPPVKRSISVEWDQRVAFERFTTRFGTWWPIRTHSVGQAKTKTAVFEGRVGGQIYEVHHDGGRSVWGTVLAWEPHSRVVFTWHPSRPPETAGEVELRFVPEGTGTRLELTHSGWENFGKGMRRARRGYNLGWKYVLDIWTGRRTPTVRILDAVTAVIRLKERFTG